MKRALITLLSLTFLMANLSADFVEGQEASSLRFVTVEGMRNKTIIPWDEPIQVLEINYTFALTNVEAAADRVNFKFWIEETEVASWFLGFSLRDPPRLQGVGGDGSFYAIEILTAEFPFKSELVDGRTYHYYRVHVYYSTMLTVSRAYFGAAYLDQPTLQGSSLLRLKVKTILPDGTAVFKDKTLHEDS